MDWYSFAVTDWEVYQDPTRTAKQVEFSKISTEQYEEITGESYSA